MAEVVKTYNDGVRDALQGVRLAAEKHDFLKDHQGAVDELRDEARRYVNSVFYVVSRTES